MADHRFARGPRWIRAAWVAVLAAALTCGGAGMATAAPTPSDTSRIIAMDWDGPTTSVKWDGRTAQTVEGSFVGNAVAVPGDRVERDATVRNDGPSDARATIEVVNVTTTNEPVAATPSFEDLIHLVVMANGLASDQVWHDARTAWETTGSARTVSFSVAKGEQFTIRAGYYFPAEATEGNTADGAVSQLSFDLRVTLSGDVQVHAPTGGRVAPDLWWSWFVIAGIGFGGLAAARLSRRYASVAQR
ncbi:MAG: hypothetical protein LBV06_10680 [Propionibacteriaceae bacterium]|nr:hypothetical protein [Propionibacteriaceae bacterium]